MVEGRVTKMSPNDARRIIQAIGESFFLIFFIVLMVIIYDTVIKNNRLHVRNRDNNNGYQHLSNRDDQPTTTTITDNLLNNDDCRAVWARAPVVQFFSFPTNNLLTGFFSTLQSPTLSGRTPAESGLDSSPENCKISQLKLVQFSGDCPVTIPEIVWPDNGVCRRVHWNSPQTVHWNSPPDSPLEQSGGQLPERNGLVIITYYYYYY